jgi:glycosyltransferase involved in cell wall biosynthesis
MEKFIVIENGTIGSPRRKEPEAVVTRDLLHPSVVSIGAVSSRKGVDTLLKAVEMTKTPVHVYWVGNRDWPEFEQELSVSPAKERFHLVGFDAEPLSYLKGADAFVLPSRRETFPLAILEAKEAGLPIISSDVDGCADALQNGKEGILVHSESAEGFAEAIDLLFSDEATRQKFARASAESAMQFSTKRMTERYLEVYRQLIS